MRVGDGRWGQVLARCTDRKECPVLDFLASVGTNDEKDVAKMLRLLRERVPAAGPPVHNTELSKPLEDGIFEFRCGALRVLYFYDQGQVVICTHGFYKRTRKTPRSEIIKAKDFRDTYRTAAVAGTVRVFGLNDEEG